VRRDGDDRRHGRQRQRRRDRPADRLRQGRGHGGLQPGRRAARLGPQLDDRQVLGPGELRRDELRRLPRHRRAPPPAALAGAHLRHQPRRLRRGPRPRAARRRAELRPRRGALGRPGLRPGRVRLLRRALRRHARDAAAYRL
ncbi:MAG: hypothetical protein AVDCRST_MAG13-734, partial [uncultured Solirubrobacteraceae bacterium]